MTATTYQGQRVEAYKIGYADGLAKRLTVIDKVAEQVGYEMPAPTSDGYPYDLARCYLQGHTEGGTERVRKHLAAGDVHCPTCGAIGTVRYRGSSPVDAGLTCPDCGGTGWVPRSHKARILRENAEVKR